MLPWACTRSNTDNPRYLAARQKFDTKTDSSECTSMVQMLHSTFLSTKLLALDPKYSHIITVKIDSKQFQIFFFCRKM